MQKSEIISLNCETVILCLVKEKQNLHKLKFTA